MNRRGFLQSIAAGLSAAIIPSGVLMPTRKLIVPDLVWERYFVSPDWATNSFPDYVPGDMIRYRDALYVFTGADIFRWDGQVRLGPQDVERSDLLRMADTINERRARAA